MTTIVQIIDQRALPHQFVIEDIDSSHKMGVAIKDMHLRGAPCIGAAAAYGMYLAALEAPKEGFGQYLKQQSIKQIVNKEDKKALPKMD